jgi:acylphosphatase
MSRANNSPTEICRLCLVSGNVQGVFYRASTEAEARRLGVRGWAKNLSDGRVEVLACGSPGSVNVLCEWLWRGSPMCSVEAVELRDEEVEAYEGLDGFRAM